MAAYHVRRCRGDVYTVCDPGGINPDGTKGVLRNAAVATFLYTTDAAIVTLVSREVIPDPPSDVPEPGTLILLGTGVISCISPGASRSQSCRRKARSR